MPKLVRTTEQELQLILDKIDVGSIYYLEDIKKIYLPTGEMIDMSEIEQHSFRPVECTESSLAKYQDSIIPGFLYFATDSKKIYLGTQDDNNITKLLPMGGNSGVYYGNRVPAEGEGDTEDISFDFIISTEIEGENTPNVNDLILNEPDGCFYRVSFVNEDEDFLTATKLTVSGTGGGGGPSGQARPQISDLEKNSSYISVDDVDKTVISFIGKSVTTENNYIDLIEIYFGKTSAPTVTLNQIFQFNEKIEIPLKNYKNYLNFSGDGSNEIGIIIQDAYGTRSYKKTFNFYILNLFLTTEESAIISKIQENNGFTPYNYSCTPRGGNVKGDVKRYIQVDLAPLNNPGNYIFSSQQEINLLNQSLTFSIPMNSDQITHGVYILTATYFIFDTIEEKIIAKSKTLTHQLVCVDPNNEQALIASDFVDTFISQYSKTTIKYMVAKGNLNTSAQAKVYIENDYETKDIVLNQLNDWSFTLTEIGSFILSIEFGNVRQNIGVLTVEKYSDENIPVVDTSTAELNLSAVGKSNNSSNKEVWEWKYGNSTYKAKFSNFLWGTENGWVEDPDGAPALKMTSGARLEIPNYYPFAYGQDALKTGLTIELDFMFSNIMNYNEPLIQCLSRNYNADGTVSNYKVGININGQKATLNSENYKTTTDAIGGEEDEQGKVNEKDIALQSLTQFFNENTRIHLTYVIQRKVSNGYYFVYTYVNGILSGIMVMNSNESFEENTIDPAYFIFDSTNADIYLYGIRVYRQALEPNNVINNYIADISDINKKIALTKNNAIFNLNNKVSKNVIDSLSVSLGVPYVVFEGGMEMPKKFKAKDLSDEGYSFKSLDCKLPVRKDDYRLMSMAMYEKDENGTIKTLMNVPIELGKDSEFSNTIKSFNDIKLDEGYWFKQGVQVYGQGTSSMVYPVKNLRLKFINSKDYPSISGTDPLEIVCFKADFMDSSSSHNTCTGNLVDDIYSALNLQTPPQKFGKTGGKLYTAIKGYPIICFFKDYSDEDSEDDYIYIGRYNFNVDKATPEPFGFPPMIKRTGTKVTDDQGREREVVEVCGFRVETVNGKTVLPLDEENKEIEDDIVQCWEFLNNDTNSPTKFLTPEGYSNFKDAMDNAWFDYFEDRYPDAIVGIWEDFADGKASESDKQWSDEALEKGLFRMTRWVNSTATVSSEISNEILSPAVYLKTLDTAYNPNIDYYDSGYNKVDIQKVDNISYTTTSRDEDYPFNDTTVSIDKNQFINKVKQEGSYNFSYVGGSWNLFLNEGTSEVSLSEYGINISVAPREGWSITVDYYQIYSGWNSSLFEKHTIDNARYRLAKFKSEFTQYFNLDYCLFYYVMTLILLMMDSRAKNMMMASWDQTIWYPIFYDMDTMLGLNNTGFNKFSYDTEDDPADKVFNGFDSVLWNNFRECYQTEIAKFYNEIIGKMPLSKLLETYNEKGADAWNEALTTQDAIYKYERPFKEGYYDGKNSEQIKPGAMNYLYASQGRRSNHRAWWLKNRLNYLNSKYKPLSLGNQKPGQSEAFSFRAYALPSQASTAEAEACVRDVPADHRFQLTALTNSYQSLFVGNIVYGPVFAKGGSTVTVGPEFPKHEVESYILNPTLIIDLGDLSNKYIGSWKMPDNKLTSLRFGRSSRSHPTNYSTYYNALLTSLDIGTSTPYLTYLNVARCIALPTLDLKSCNRLQEVDAEKSQLTSIVFPESSVLKKLYLPRTLGQLEIRNQPYLETIEFDEKVNNSLNFTRLILENAGTFNSYNIVKEVFENKINNIRYLLTGINWIIDDFSTSKVTSISILDRLLEINQNNLSPMEGYSLATAVTGTITIKGNVEVNEYEIYLKYKKKFPGINFKYEVNSENFTPAKKVTFLNDSVENNGKVYYEVLSDGSQTISNLISADGPTGAPIEKPNKNPTVEYEYKFTGYWYEVDDTNNQKYYYETLLPVGTVIDPMAKNFNEENVGDKNRVFYPEFSNAKRIYKISFYDDTGLLIPQDGKDFWSVPYGELYSETGPMVNYYYKDESNLPEEQRYTFLGWGTVRNQINPEFINPEQLIVEKDLNLFAYFKQESVYASPTNLNYFSFNVITWNGYSYKGTTVVIPGGNYACLTVKDSYKGKLQGKITLPEKLLNTPITGIYQNTFANLDNITHVFFPENGQYEYIGEKAFQNCQNLQTVKIPKTIKIIDKNAFQYDYALKNINNLNDQIEYIGDGAFSGNISNSTLILQIELNELPTNLKYIGQQGFFRAGHNVKISKLPEKICSMGSQAFAGCSHVAIIEFGSDNDSSMGPYLEEIPSFCFQQSGNGLNSNPEEIKFLKSIQIIQSSAFQNSYASDGKNIKKIYFGNEAAYNSYNNNNTGLAKNGVEIEQLFN